MSMKKGWGKKFQGQPKPYRVVGFVPPSNILKVAVPNRGGSSWRGCL